MNQYQTKLLDEVDVYFKEVVSFKNKKRVYPQELKNKIIELVNQGISREILIVRFNLPRSLLYKWSYAINKKKKLNCKSFQKPKRLKIKLESEVDCVTSQKSRVIFKNGIQIEISTSELNESLIKFLHGCGE